LFASIVKTQAFPETSEQPVHPVNVEFVPATAVSVTTVPLVYVFVLPVIEPCPVPEVEVVRV